MVDDADENEDKDDVLLDSELDEALLLLLLLLLLSSLSIVILSSMFALICAATRKGDFIVIYLSNELSSLCC